MLPRLGRALQCFAGRAWEGPAYLVRVVFQRAVVALIADPVHVGVPLVHVVDVLAVVSFVENTCREQGQNSG